MNSVKLPGFMNDIGAFCKAEAPTIMSFAAVGGVIATAILAFRARPKYEEVLKERDAARKRIAEEEERIKSGEIEDTEERKAARKSEKRRILIDHIIGSVKVFWLATLVGIATCSLIIGANRISVRRIAMYAGAYEVASGDLKKYKEKALEVVGDKKAEEIEKKVVEDDVKAACDHNGHPKVIYNTEKGDILYYDKWSGRFFKSCPEEIQKAVICVMEALQSEHFAPLNYFYDFLGIPTIGAGEEFGFDSKPKISEESTWVETPGGDKAIALSFPVKIAPKGLGDYIPNEYKND